jgi:hypothetical protein
MIIPDGHAVQPRRHCRDHGGAPIYSRLRAGSPRQGGRTWVTEGICAARQQFSYRLGPPGCTHSKADRRDMNWPVAPCADWRRTAGGAWSRLARGTEPLSAIVAVGNEIYVGIDANPPNGVAVKRQCGSLARVHQPVGHAPQIQKHNGWRPLLQSANAALWRDRWDAMTFLLAPDPYRTSSVRPSHRPIQSIRPTADTDRAAESGR